MPNRREQIEQLASVALAPLVEIAWADGRVTPAERKAVLDAAGKMGLGQRDFCQTTLARWLHEAPPTEALSRWRRLLAPTLASTPGRAARASERRLLEAASVVARMDAPGVVGDSGVTPEEARVLEDLKDALAAVSGED